MKIKDNKDRIFLMYLKRNWAILLATAVFLIVWDIFKLYNHAKEVMTTDIYSRFIKNYDATLLEYILVPLAVCLSYYFDNKNNYIEYINRRTPAKKYKNRIFIYGLLYAVLLVIIKDRIIFNAGGYFGNFGLSILGDDRVYVLKEIRYNNPYLFTWIATSSRVVVMFLVTYVSLTLTKYSKSLLLITMFPILFRYFMDFLSSIILKLEYLFFQFQLETTNFGPNVYTMCKVIFSVIFMYLSAILLINYFGKKNINKSEVK